MEVRELLKALAVAERLKDTTRHCYTAGGRHESVAEHSWMLTVMAFFLKEEFPALAARCEVMLPDEKTRRVGQSVAAASLPAIKK